MWADHYYLFLHFAAETESLSMWMPVHSPNHRAFPEFCEDGRLCPSIHRLRVRDIYVNSLLPSFSKTGQNWQHWHQRFNNVITNNKNKVLSPMRIETQTSEGSVWCTPCWASCLYWLPTLSYIQNNFSKISMTYSKRVEFPKFLQNHWKFSTTG